MTGPMVVMPWPAKFQCCAGRRGTDYGHERAGHFRGESAKSEDGGEDDDGDEQCGQMDIR